MAGPDFASMLAMINPGPSMDVGTARAAGAGGGGPFSAGISGGGGALMPYTGGASPLVGAMQQAGIGAAPFELPGMGAPIAMGGGAAPAASAGLLGGLEGAALPAAGGAGLLARGLPTFGKGLGGMGLAGGLKTFLRGAPAVAAEEGGLAGTAATAGALNPLTAAMLAAPMIGNPLLSSMGVKGNNPVRRGLMDALTGGGLAGGVGAGLGALGLVSGPVGWGLLGAGALGGGLYGLLHHGPQPMTLGQGQDQLNKMMDTAQLDPQARDSVLGQMQAAWATTPDSQHKQILQAAGQLIPEARQAQVQRMAQQLVLPQMLQSITQYTAPGADRLANNAQRAYDFQIAQANSLDPARAAFMRSAASQMLQDTRGEAEAYKQTALMAPLLAFMNQRGQSPTAAANNSPAQQAATGSNADYVTALASAMGQK